MRIKKGDLVILIIVIAAVAGWLLKDLFWLDQINKLAVIKIDSQVYTTLPLDSNNERMEIPLTLPADNHILIVSEKGQIWVEDSSCPDKVCVRTGKISKSGQSAVCLPNKTVVYIEGAEQTEIDDVSY